MGFVVGLGWWDFIIIYYTTIYRDILLFNIGHYIILFIIMMIIMYMGYSYDDDLEVS